MTSLLKERFNENISLTIKLSPFNKLVLESQNDTSTLNSHFNTDWREGWFYLAASKMNVDEYPTLRFWQNVANYFITKLCHLPAEEGFSYINHPSNDICEKWILEAPFMIGREYLSFSTIQVLWNELNAWVKIASEKEGIHSFLEKKAPKWNQVGRVCFHLAENKNNKDYPFAFLSTYSTGFTTDNKIKHLPLSNAFEKYAKTNDKNILINLLTPVYNASKKCRWVEKLLETRQIFKPLLWTHKEAYNLLVSIPLLEESGLSIKIPNWWKKRSRVQVSVKIGSNTKPSLGLDSMLDFNMKIALGDQDLTKDELDKIFNQENGLVCIRGQWIEVDSAKLKEAIDHWKKIQNNCKNNEISFIEGMRLLAEAPSNTENSFSSDEEHFWVNVSAGSKLKEVLAVLKDPSKLSISDNIDGLQAILRPYQKDGVNWLYFLAELGLGSCLADDMGLGKTIQILSLLLIQKNKNLNSSLLVVPASLLGNWQLEIKRFAPSLKILLLHPSEIDKNHFFDIVKNPLNTLNNFDLIITTYSMIIRYDELTKINWNLLILDEAQAIKNPETKQSQFIKKYNAKAKIALTGTPIENSLSDLWSLFDFINRGLLGSLNNFKNYISTLESQNKNYESIRKLVSPYILRRMKSDPKIISDLPDKIEVPVYCQLTKEQAKYYLNTIDNLEKSLKIVSNQARRGLILQSILRLKQICNHPCHFTGHGNYPPLDSGKFIRLKEICKEINERQQKVLIFTQFKEIIPFLEEFLATIFQKKGLILHGDTKIKERKNIVEYFQKENGPPFLVLSLKAGGTGLNLTAASHVVHFDRWWNPSVENQATDRAFRIGQKNNVLVHKFITQGTIEEKIDQIITSKKQLAEEILSTSDEVKITELNDSDLLKLVALDINRAILET